MCWTERAKLKMNKRDFGHQQHTSNTRIRKISALISSNVKSPKQNISIAPGKAFNLCNTVLFNSHVEEQNSKFIIFLNLTPSPIF